MIGVKTPADRPSPCSMFWRPSPRPDLILIGCCAQRRSRVSRRPSRSREHGSRLCWFGWDRSLPLHFCYRPDLFLRLSVGKTTTIPRGAHHQARTSRHKLVFGRSVRIATMMQSCASAAKLRGGGPILRRGSKTKSQVGLPPPRSVSCSLASR